MKWIIPAVIIAITALIVFQINWLLREAEMKKEDEKRRASEAVRETCMTLEEQFTKGFMRSSLDSLLDKRPFVVNDSVHIEMNADSMKQVIVINSDSEGAQIIHEIHQPPLPPDAPLPPVPPPAPVWMNSDSANVLIMRRTEHAKNALQDVMMQYVYSAGIPANVDTARLDSILDAQLKLRGIDYNYVRKVVAGPEYFERRSDTSNIPKEWEFRAKLYAADGGPFGPELRVEIQPNGGSALMRILPQILFSFLITAGMLILFLLIYREAKRQKKIGDIRRDFINNMTHEFKTPLATMSLAADTIMNEKVIGDRDKVKYYAEQIKAENKKLNQQVEKVLELALTEKTGVLMNKERLNLTEVVLRAMKAMEMQVEAKGGSMVLETNPEVILIDADSFHLERVFINLIDNALKYGGNPPRITLSIVPYRSGTEIKISDNGFGISSSDWNLIFEPFHRVSTGDVHNVKGFGLGLSYAKSVIKEHNGSISVSKSDKSGTTFTVVLMHNPGTSA